MKNGKQNTYASIPTLVLNGLRPEAVRVEAVIRPGIPAFTISGIAPAQAREISERVRAALQCSGFRFPRARIVVNLAPSSHRKTGTHFDLPVAAALLAAMGLPLLGRKTRNIQDTLFLGELSLSGELLPLESSFSLLYGARNLGYRKIAAPWTTEEAAPLVPDMFCLGARTLREISRGGPVNGGNKAPGSRVQSNRHDPGPREIPVVLDSLEIAPRTKKTLLVAAHGRHNLLLIGPPGAGKSSLIRLLPALQPSPDPDEVLEILAVQNALGDLCDRDLSPERPFRTPHHSCTVRALVGGGHPLQPGEATRAHNGILFLDEFAEFSRSTLQALREPLQEKRMLLSRGSSAMEYPANFMLCAAMNPCPCGNFGEIQARCECSENERRNYIRRVEGALLDRIDMRYRLERTGGANRENYSIEEMKKMLLRAESLRRERFRGTPYRFNSEIPYRELDKYAPFGKDSLREKWKKKTELMSYRAQAGIRRLARSVADLAGVDRIRAEDLLEALAYRRPNPFGDP